MIRVLDTSVLVYDPTFLDSYPGDDLVIPLTVIRELDGMKSSSAHPGPSARAAVRALDELASEHPLSDPAPRAVGGTVRVEMNHMSTSRLPRNTEVVTADDRILLVAYNLADEADDEVVLVTQDRSMGLIGQTWGLTVQRHQGPPKVELPEVVRLSPSAAEIEDLYAHGVTEVEVDLAVNTPVILSAGSSSALAVATGDRQLRLARPHHMSGITPRGAHQQLASSLLMDSGREFLGSLSGRAGSGKTLCALAAGLARVARGDYRRIVVFRPTEPVGRDLGYLPGSLDEKMAPWQGAVGDVLTAMGLDPDGSVTLGGRQVVPLVDVISVESVNFVRGRTFADTYVVVDEAQNLEPTVLRTVLSRLGSGSAGVMTWDPSQVDNPFLRSAESAPYALMSSVLPNPSAWHIALPNPERGGVSALIP